MRCAFSLPTKADKVPTGSEWIHEIKHDGYRIVVVRDHDRVRMISRGGHDWGDRFPLVVAGALKLPEMHFVIDGEVVVLRPDGVSDFDALHSRKHDKRAVLCAFDQLAGDGKDLRTLPLSLRKAGLADLLSDEVDGIFIAEYEKGDIGPVLFQVACNMGLEGIVSKHMDRPYGAGRCKHQEPRTSRVQQGEGLPSGAPIAQIDVAGSDLSLSAQFDRPHDRRDSLQTLVLHFGTGAAPKKEEAVHTRRAFLLWPPRPANGHDEADRLAEALRWLRPNTNPTNDLVQTSICCGN
jgi:bifunctional non-homologous end joining protein LigD